MKTWTEICQANVDHYNANPAKHNTEVAVYAAVVTVAFVALRRKLAKKNAIR